MGHTAAYGIDGRRAEPDERTQAAERAAAWADIRAWTSHAGLPEPGAARVDEILAQGYMSADDGMIALLAELGVLTPEGDLHPEAPLWSMDEALDRLRHPQPVEVSLATGDSGSVPTRAQRMFLAAPLIHEGDAWKRFVRRHELEQWGEPACLIADSGEQVPAGGLAGWSPWHLILGSDPAVSLIGWHGALAAARGLPDLGPWVVIPDLAGANQDSYGDRLTLDPPRDTARGPAYGATLRLYVTSVRQRASEMRADNSGWEHALKRLRQGELRALSITLTRFNGEGRYSQYQGGLEVSVTLRDQFTKPTGPLPDKRPATIVLAVAKSLLERTGSAGVTRVVNLMRRASTRCRVAHGYASTSGHPGQHQSQYERRHGLVWNGTRLDTTTRGVHWGNLIGPGHVAAIGGPDRLRQLLADGDIAVVEQWGTDPDLWWYQLTDDPYDPANQRADQAGRLLREITPHKA